MADLRPDDFVPFFRETRGFEPFRWQVDLAERLCQQPGLPDVIEVPTGLGKTSVIHCWTFALAVQATRPARKLPLRLFLVVDRRLVVDSAYQDVTQLSRALAEAQKENLGPVGAAARALHALHDDPSQPPLTGVRMRGGVTWASRWLPRPDQPAVVVGTVDQFGSRALFRGYGVSAGMRPIDAALTATDSWLIVDEAHIAQPLVGTVGQVQAYQALHQKTGIRPLVATQMSATAGQTAADVFRADLEAQTDDPALPQSSAAARRRLDVEKPVLLVDLKALRTGARKPWAEKSAALGHQLAEVAIQVQGEHGAVGVVANTVSTARATHAHLIAQGAEAILLIGRVREHERERILNDWLPVIEAGSTDRPPGRLFVVATQTIEVGANLDFDALVTECAPLSALVQRFGRVNRLGERSPRASVIVHAASLHEQDPVYGEATAATWSYLADQAAPVTVSGSLAFREWPEPLLDFGLRSVPRHRAGAPEGVEAPAVFVPIAIGSHFERWAATQPAPFPDQPVGPFLHGVERVVPEVEVAWRAAPDGLDAADWKLLLELARPLAWEFVTVPIWEIAALIAGSKADAPTPDLEGAPVGGHEAPPAGEDGFVGVVYGGPDEQLRPVRRPGDVRPGDRVILASSLGGHDAWGWTGRRGEAGGAPVPDVADLAPGRAGLTVRLQETVIATLVPPEERAAVADAFAPIRALHASAPLDTVEEASRAVGKRLEVLSLPPEILRLVRPGDSAPSASVRLQPTGSGHAILLTRADRSGGRQADVSDADVASSSGGAHPVALVDHQRAVERLARSFAHNLGLPAPMADAVALAGRLHDMGKADPRFQVMLHDGDELAALAAPSPRAKSGRDFSDPTAHAARRLAKLPRGFRHEALSEDLAAAWVAAGQAQNGIDPELLRHLIASHHGHARPLMSAVEDPEPPRVAMEILGEPVEVAGGHRVDWEQPGRFARLNERYGWWGLALLETLVRLADIRCSEVGT